MKESWILAWGTPGKYHQMNDKKPLHKIKARFLELF
jgi:hypothetical protein